MPRKLPPLNAIRAFEASARLGGFVAASQELGVTPGAVSMQIRKLEEYYDVALFRRFASGVELTEVGGTIFGECSSALSALEATNDLIAARETRTRIVVSCINSIAHRWLSRHLAMLAGSVPDHWIELRAEPDPVDFDDHQVDVRITYGEHLYPHLVAKPLFIDRLMPLCTPDFAIRADLKGNDIGSLRDEHLIQSWWTPSFWAYPTWADWFEAASAPRQARVGTGPSANMPALAIDMALTGLGVALGQHSLASEEIRSGRLIAPFPTTLSMPSPYALVLPRSARRQRRVARAVAFLMAEAAKLNP